MASITPPGGGGARHGPRSSSTINSERELPAALRFQARAGDTVVCLGAGNSTEWAHALPEWLAQEPVAPREVDPREPA